MGFPGGAGGKGSARQCRRHRKPGFHPWVGKIPWSRKWHPTPVFLPGKAHGQRSLAGCSPRGGRVRYDQAHMQRPKRHMCVCMCVYIYICIKHLHPFIHLWPLACFHILATINTVAMNTAVHVSFQISVFVSFRHIPRSAIAGSHSSEYIKKEADPKIQRTN